MAKTLEIIIKDKAPIKIDENQKVLKDFISYLNDKYAQWEEFVISNKFEKQIRIVKGKDELIQLPKTLSIGNLIVFLDKNYKDWNRFAISKFNFKEISYSDCVSGMLVRASTSNTNQYIYIDDVSFDKKNEKEINCTQEGKKVTFNTLNCSKYKFALLSNSIEKSNFNSIDWAESK